MKRAIVIWYTPRVGWAMRYAGTNRVLHTAGTLRGLLELAAVMQ